MEQKQDASTPGKKITRKQAIKKAGLMAASTATMMVLLNNNAHASSAPNDCFDPKNHGNGHGHGHGNGPKGSPGR